MGEWEVDGVGSGRRRFPNLIILRTDLPFFHSPLGSVIFRDAAAVGLRDEAVSAAR